MTINSTIRTRVEEALLNIEQSESVRILYACESGSRAWGFASQDSDFDVRFLYVREPDWYFSIDVERRRDVIERPISDQLDVSGWDLRKALNLLRKSNPPLARGNFRDYLRGEEVWVKKYFYVLRPLLAILWIEEGRGVVPIQFRTLLDAVVRDPALRQAIDGLLDRKLAGDELDRGPRIPIISAFIERELDRLEQVTVEQDRPESDWAALNDLFRKLVREAWAE